jgi:hypothetical protein
VTRGSALAAIVLFASTAHAAVAFDLTYTAPAGCPTRAAIEAEIAAYLANSSGPAVRAEIAIEGTRAKVTTTINGTKGERTLEANTCDEAAHAAALVIALAVDPNLTSAPPSSIPTPPPKPTPPPEPTPAVEPAKPEPPPKPTRAGPRFGLTLAAGPTVDAAALPGAAFGVAARIGTDVGRLVPNLGFVFLPSAKKTVAGRDAGGEFAMVGGSAGACVKITEFLGPCASFELGRMRAAGFGARATNAGSALWSAVLLGLSGGLRGRPIGVRAEAWIVIPTTRPDFVIEDIGVVHTPRVGVRATLLLEVSIL